MASILYILAGGLLALLFHIINLQATDRVSHAFQYIGALLAGGLFAYFAGRTREKWLRRNHALEKANQELKREMEERRQTEEALRESEERYRDLFDNSRDFIQSITPDGRLLYASRSWQEALGFKEEEVRGYHMFNIIHPDYHEHCMKRFQMLLEGKEVDKIESLFLAKNGRKILVEGNCNCKFVDGKPAFIRGIFRDVTERNRMEAELQKSQKLEAVGILAGGIAHDFNNLLSGLHGVISLLKKKLPEYSEEIQILEEAQRSCLQGKELTAKFLTFSEGGAPLKKCMVIGELLRKWVEVALSGSGCPCNFLFGDELWQVSIDEGQMQQVINNIVINAMEAMPDGGELTVAAENVEIGEEEKFELPPGRYIKMTITDQGVGIPAENLSKIFDPYFTTKNMASERGTGFGLAICYSIVRKHGGIITVESKDGEGTSLHIFLPACEG